MTEKLMAEKIIPLCADALRKNPIGMMIRFEIPDTSNTAYMRLEKDYNHPGAVYLKLDAAENGSDRLTGDYYHHADNLDEMNTWLGDAANYPGIARDIRRLSDSVDRI